MTRNPHVPDMHDNIRTDEKLRELAELMEHRAESLATAINFDCIGYRYSQELLTESANLFTVASGLRTRTASSREDV